MFLGRFEGAPIPAAAEVSDWEWVEGDTLRADVGARPRRYTPWFHIFRADVARAARGLGTV